MPLDPDDPRHELARYFKAKGWKKMKQPLRTDWVVRSKKGEAPTLNVRRLKHFSQQLRDILLKYAPELVSAAEGFSRDVIYIPVSALGCSPEVDENGALGIRPRDIEPMWSDVPMLYALHRSVRGLVPSSRGPH